MSRKVTLNDRYKQSFNKIIQGNVTINENISVDKNNSDDISRNNDNDVSGNISGNIVIKKAQDKVKIKRVSYYLKPTTIKKIEQLAKVADMGISEFLQTILDAALEQVKIEE